MFTINTQVYPSTCDKNGKMKLYAVMQRMQDCSELWLKSEPMFAKYFKDNGMAQLLAYRQLDILRLPHYGEQLRVSTSVYEVNALFGHRNTCIYDTDGLPCCVSWSMGAFVNRATGRLQKVPEDVQKSLVFDKPIEMEYTERRIILPQNNAETRPKIAVQRTDIDYNQHVNNAEYLRMTLNLLPDNFATKRVRIEYKVPTKLGDTIVPSVIESENDVYVIMHVGELICTVFQFSGVKK